MKKTTEITKYLSQIGSKGGKSKSEAKKQASRLNAAKALESRKKNKYIKHP